VYDLHSHTYCRIQQKCLSDYGQVLLSNSSLNFVIYIHEGTPSPSPFLDLISSPYDGISAFIQRFQHSNERSKSNENFVAYANPIHHIKTRN
jgi:hypothetical protein